MQYTIEKTVRDNLCTGCGTCVSLCNRNAITLLLDEDKVIYIPQLNSANCVNCGLCYKLCP